MQQLDGFVLKINGRYVSAVLANGHPEKPVVYYNDDVAYAKTWKTPQAVRKARARIGKRGSILIYQQEGLIRRIVGRLGKETEKPSLQPVQEVAERPDDYDEKQTSGLLEE